MVHDVGNSDLEKASVEYKDDGQSSEEYVVDPVAERRLLRKLDTRVGNAKVLNDVSGDDLQQTIHLSNQEYTTALMVFLVAYFIFETPSNYMLKAFRPSRWIAFLMFSWGVMTICLGAATSFGSLAAVRFLLGMFEAGLFPGLVYFLTFWYKPNERAMRIACILACATLGLAFGGALAYGIGQMNGARGLQAWRWLFILEGIPSCVLAFLVLAVFPDYPETVGWLSNEERELATKRLRGLASSAHSKITWEEAKRTLKEWRLYIHYIIYICISVPFSSLSLFSPSLISGLGYTGLRAQLFTVPPYAVAFVVTVTVSWLSDKYEKRSLGAASCMLISGIAFIVEGSLAPTAFKARYGVLFLASSFSFGSIPPLLSWLTANLQTTGACTLGVPMNVSMGALGQIMGVYIYKANEAPGYKTGHFTNAAFSLLGTVLCLVLRAVYVRWNLKLGPNERKWRV
ncbi:hypothetical protein D9757_003136 [Collybiopsis confluens]|uniref:Major facilitator superfamily (MFS) profile domain-containing protein n=1 Tax=Collybiopsis confluens TaxID=2823264 RepID=A0A8H5HXF3_9AGAR|nr:hypothetical protein D9757_003136 [Collybiopsis confluens]